MQLPVSTYRFQVNSSYTFKHLKEVVPYLKKLGISTVYSAPFFVATKGSTHGYDGVNPDMINPEIGTLEELRDIAKLLKENNMTWLQDIVPNHMAFDVTNVWLMDVLEKGEHSEYASFFDIDWQHPDPELKGKVLAPFLGTNPEEVAKSGDLKVTYGQQGFFISAYGNQYPASWISYYDILNTIDTEKAPEDFRHFLGELKSVKDKFKEDFSALHMMRHKENLFQWYNSDAKFKQQVDQRIEQINKDWSQLKEVLDQQFFKLAYYIDSDTKINYRRFFVVNGLICLKMEDEKVFQYYHRFLKRLMDEKLVQSLRVDHIDGVHHPKEYLDRLRQLAGDNTYIIVEKILESEEKMVDWAIQGTSGYEFLANVNQVLTKTENQHYFTTLYKDFTGLSPQYEDLVLEKKAYMLRVRMGGEQENLLNLFLQTSAKDQVKDKAQLKEALFQLMISFPVYRTYVDKDTYSECDERIVQHALEKARLKHDELNHEFGLIENVISKEGVKNEANLKFLMRFQQFTGPLAAKGVEDTVFYVYNRHIAHNEVGDSPKSFGLTTEQFHQKMLERKKSTPYSINTLSTHDTKRGEDGRARINVLSEIPEEWSKTVQFWKEINKKHKTEGNIPDNNDEYFIYQSLIGGFPMEGWITEDFTQRVKDFMLKALRESKVHTDYPNFNIPYEEGTMKFLEAILADQEFITSFSSFFEKIANYGILKSLSQTLIKITAPGIPDTYQGSELWEISFVDPDNRRPIDYEMRQNFLEEILAQKDREALAQQLLAKKREGKIKLFVTSIALSFRLQNPSLFADGQYIPLEIKGSDADQIIGYARNKGDEWAFVIIPKDTQFFTEELQLKEESWRDTIVKLPNQFNKKLLNVFTENAVDTSSNEIKVREVWSHFPISLLKGQ